MKLLLKGKENLKKKIQCGKVSLGEDQEKGYRYLSSIVDILYLKLNKGFMNVPIGVVLIAYINVACVHLHIIKIL